MSETFGRLVSRGNDTLTPAPEAILVPVTAARLPWRARRNLARQIDELVAAGRLASVRELVRSQTIGSQVNSVINLCNDATVAILLRSSELRSMARSEEEHGIITRNAAFTQVLVQQIIADEYVM